MDTYRALRSWVGREGQVRRGEILMLDDRRAVQLMKRVNPLVAPAPGLVSTRGPAPDTAGPEAGAKATTRRTGLGAPLWYPDWTGLTVFILASGPSLADAPVERLRGGPWRVIAVNRSWERAPWADLLHGCDLQFWAHYGGVPKFAGLKSCTDKAVLRRPWGVNHISVDRRCDTMLLDRPGVIGWGGNSGFHAVQLAALFGARRIGLVGYDMTVRGGLHWHGAHPSGLHNPTEKNVARWRRVLDAAAPVLAARKIEVKNCAPGSALEAYEKCSLIDATGAWR